MKTRSTSIHPLPSNSPATSSSSSSSNSSSSSSSYAPHPTRKRKAQLDVSQLDVDGDDLEAEPIDFKKDIFSPLIPKILLGDIEEEESAEELQEKFFKGLVEDYKKIDKDDIGTRELAKFMATQLSKQKDFNGLVLNKKANRDRNGNRVDAYDTEDRNITMAPLDKDVSTPNPISTLIHEGTHALDHSHMRTYQNSAIDLLAKHLGNTPIDKDNGKWYTGAQEILKVAAPDFHKYYPFKPVGKGKKTPSNVVKNIKDSMYNLEPPAKLRQPQSILTYGAAKKKLDSLKKIGKKPEHDLFFESLSEFPAFAVESLSKPWNIKWDEPKKPSKPRSSKAEAVDLPSTTKNNLGRKFMKKTTKAVHNNFRELDPDFAKNYPTTDLNFLNRLSELRNINKYPAPEDFIANYKSKL